MKVMQKDSSPFH